MIELDFSKGNLAAHQQLVEILSASLKKRTRFIRDSYEYEIQLEKTMKPLTLGEIDLVASFKGNLVLIEVKTNDDLKGAIKSLNGHQKNIELILEKLPRKLTAGVHKLTYLVILYELYTIYKLKENGEVEELCSIDEFLENLPIA